MLIQRKPQGVLPHFLRGGKQNGGMIRAAEFLHDLFLRRGKVCVIEMFRLAVPVCRRLGAVRNCRAPQHHLIALLFRLMAALQEYAVIYALTKGGPGDALMSLSLTAYQQGFKFQKFGAALPYILILWLIINVVAKEIVKRQRSAQKQAAGLDE